MPRAHRGRLGRKWTAASIAGSFRACRRRTMRNLYSGNDPGRLPASGAVSASHRRSDPRRAGGKLVPLHRIPKDFRRGPGGPPYRLSHMRAYVPEYDLVAPESLAEALRIIAREPGVWRPIAGGTDLMVLFEAGKL